MSCRECKVVLKCLMCDCSNEAHYRGNLECLEFMLATTVLSHHMRTLLPDQLGPHKMQAKYIGNSSYHSTLIPRFWLRVYFTIHIHPDHYKCLRFEWNLTLFEFICLPFVLSSAARVYTKVLKPFVRSIRNKGIRLVRHLYR